MGNPVPHGETATPGISGAISDAVRSLKSYLHVGDRETSGNRSEQDQLDSVSGAEGNHSSTVSSNAGRNNQSTDAQNRY